ncbi:MAG TPA: helix-turn-helix transcriptional regulator [Flavobacteriales bacterium]|nr:helix-turn-helix transcriptional regulator [Flavobacteriales bacterium]
MRYLRDEKFIKLVGKRVRQVRLMKNISQAQLAADCDVEISQISRIERGVINTSLSQINNIARNLKVHPKDLLDV